MRLARRDFVGLAGAFGIGALAGGMAIPRAARAAEGQVVVVGGGFAGATCAKYLKRAAPGLRVTLVDAAPVYHTCPMSNAVIAGLLPPAAIEVGRQALAERYGIELVQARVAAIDPPGRSLRLEGGQTLAFDRLVVAPGIDFRYDRIEGLSAEAAETMPHAWQAGPQTALLRRQIEAMADGGTVILAIPPAPFRCPPGPYERASLIAHYLKRAKPRSKLLILDANDRMPKQELILEGWEKLYPGLIEWVPSTQDGTVVAADAKTRTVFTQLGEHPAEVVNLIPPQQAADIARSAGLADATGWCPVDPASLESRRAPGVHVIGDAALTILPKSAGIANTAAKVCAGAVAALLAGEQPGAPSFVNACYSLLAPDYGIAVAGVYEVAGGEIRIVDGASGTSPLGASARYRAREAKDAEGWYKSIVADSFA